MTTTVSAILVCHDGARWLPGVLDGLAAQERPPDRVVVVDTGSTDAGPRLAAQRLGPRASYLTLPRSTPFGSAVRAATTGGPTGSSAGEDWVWLLHDDSAPAPEALARLLAAAQRHPDAAVLGPALREWPSLRRLLEVGVTLTGTGRRETGLEHGEYDQGQFGDREVLAVNTAGMLVRAEAVDLLGFDDHLPVLGADLDFGWRAARSGLRVVVAPDAVVFHAEATRRGSRPGVGFGPDRRPRRGERRAVGYTLLANTAALAVPLVALRLVLAGALRALGLLLVRAPAEAADELLALTDLARSPGELARARRSRRGLDTVAGTAPGGVSWRAQRAHVRTLRAPFWLPYRRGVDAVADLARAVAHDATDRAELRRRERERQGEPLWVRRVVLPAVAAALLVGTVLSTRHLWGGGVLSGGALLPPPGGVGSWWSLVLDRSHALGTGSTQAPGGYVALLALAGTLLGGQPSLLVSLLFCLVVPLGAAGGYRFLRAVTSSRPAAAWGAVAYALLPVLSGAWQQGRLGTVAALVVLPWLARSALDLRPQLPVDRRWRAAWRTALWNAVLVAFVPTAALLAAGVAAAAVVVVALEQPRRTWASQVGAVLVPVLAPAVLLLPWTVSVVSGSRGASWLSEAGLPLARLTLPVSRSEVLLARLTDQGAPGWLTAGLVLIGLAAALRPDTRRGVLAAGVVVVVSLGVTALLAGSLVEDPSTGTAHRLWLGFPVLVAHAAGLCAAVVAAGGLTTRLRGASFGWQQALGALLATVAVVCVVGGGLWWATGGAPSPLRRAPATSMPAYLQDATRSAGQGVLVVTGATGPGYHYLLLRQPALWIGDDTVLPSARAQRPVSAALARLIAEPGATTVRSLRRLGADHVYAPPPVDPALASALDGAAGVEPASGTRAGGRVWQLTSGRAGQTSGTTDPSTDPSTDPVHDLLLAGQLAALLVASVLAAPARRTRS